MIHHVHSKIDKNMKNTAHKNSPIANTFQYIEHSASIHILIIIRRGTDIVNIDAQRIRPHSLHQVGLPVTLAAGALRILQVRKIPLLLRAISRLQVTSSRLLQGLERQFETLLSGHFE